MTLRAFQTEFLLSQPSFEQTRIDQKVIKNDSLTVLGFHFCELNRKEKLWDFLLTVLGSIINGRHWKNIGNFTRGLKSAAEIAKVLFSSLQKLRWDRKLLLFGFEIALNICRLHEYCHRIDPSGSKGAIVDDGVQMKLILAALKKFALSQLKANIYDLISKHTKGNESGGEPSTPKMKIVSLEKIVSWNYHDLFEGQKGWPYLGGKDMFLSRLVTTHEYLMLQDNVRAAIVLKMLFFAHSELKNLAALTQATTAEFMRKGALSWEHRFGDITPIRPKYSSQFKRKQQSPLVVEPSGLIRCEVCQSFPARLHMYFPNCGHYIHYQHFLDKIGEKQDSGTVKSYCECLDTLKGN